jgi:methyltransferase (TIGR00027 family)
MADVKVPDHTAVRVALWRGLHTLVDEPPHVLHDEIGLRLADPEEGWRARPDMDPTATAGFRASVVARARFIDDLVAERADHGVTQYVIIGAGLDTFIQRRPELATRVRVFEIDQPDTQAWKRRRLTELGYGSHAWPSLAPVNFEDGDNWWERLAAAGFDPGQPTIVASTGVSMYLTKDATVATLCQLAELGPGSTVAMTFQLTTELLDEADQPMRAEVEKRAQAAGTPFVSYYTPSEMLSLAREAGFPTTEHVPGSVLAERYFSGRTDSLWPSSGEDFLLASI